MPAPASNAYLMCTALPTLPYVHCNAYLTCTASPTLLTYTAPYAHLTCTALLTFTAPNAYAPCFATLRLILTLRALLTYTAPNVCKPALRRNSSVDFVYVHSDCIAKVHAACIDDVRDHSLIRQVHSL